MVVYRYYDVEEQQDYFPDDVPISESSSLLDSYTKKSFEPKNNHYVVIVLLVIVSVVVCLFVFNTAFSASPSTVVSYTNSDGIYMLLIVSDMNQKSLVEDDSQGRWKSIMKRGDLRRTGDNKFTIEWVEERELFSKFNEAGRGMELSSLVNYQGMLLSFDDRTGIVYEITNNKVVPRHILMDGDGNTDRGLKTEWAAVKNDKLYIGGFGREFISPDGSIDNKNRMWVSVIHSNGEITHEDWTERYNNVREDAGYPYPGYLTHEAVSWSSIHKKWVMLPRRVSKENYDEIEDDSRGSNMVIFASEDFGQIEVMHITQFNPHRGFSDFKFLPGTNDEIIVALKTERVDDTRVSKSFLSIFDVSGRVLLEDTEIPGDLLFEGLEFY